MPLQVRLGVFHDGVGAVDGDGSALGPSVAGPAEDHPAELRRSGVVHVDGGLLGAHQRLDGALDQLLARLGQYRDADVIRDSAAPDQLADEVELRLAGRREPDLDLLVAHAHQQVEHGVLAGGVHRIDQRLVAVAQVGRQPARGLRDDPVWPPPVG